MSHMPDDIYRPETDNRTARRRVLIITADKTEDIEFFYPYYRFIEAGFEVDVATPDGGAFKGKQGLGLKETKKIANVKAADYEMLYVPGGKAPAALKKNGAALALAQRFIAEGKPIAAICHGPQLLAAADIIEGHKISAWPELEDEIAEAGATYLDRETAVDGPFITARWPGDLPSHMKHTLDFLRRIHDEIIDYAAE